MSPDDVRRFDDKDQSFMAFSSPHVEAFRQKSDFTVRVRPEVLTGMIIYTSRGQSDFLELGVQNGTVELRYNLGSGLGVIRSDTTLQLDTWHTIIVTRSGKEGKVTGMLAVEFPF